MSRLSILIPLVLALGCKDKPKRDTEPAAKPAPVEPIPSIWSSVEKVEKADDRGPFSLHLRLDGSIPVGATIYVDGVALAEKASENDGVAIAGHGAVDIAIDHGTHGYVDRHVLSGSATAWLKKKAVVRGVIVDPSGAPQTGLVVEVEKVPGAITQPWARTETAADGSFELAVLPGVVRLVARGPGHRAVANVRAGPESAAEIRLVTSPAYSIRGAIKGEVPDRTQVSWGYQDAVPVAKDGRFEIHGLDSGRYPLRLRVPSASGVMTITAGSTDAVIEDADVQTTIQLPTLHTLEVTVTGAIPSGTDLLFERAGETGTALGRVVIGPDGRVRIPALAVGTLQKVRTEVAWSDLVDIEVPGVGKTTIKVPDSRLVKGHIQGGRENHLVPDALLTLRDARGRVVIARGDAHGNFSFPPVPVGTYRLQRFAGDELRMERGEGDLENASVVEVGAADLSLLVSTDHGPGTFVRGRVFDRNGKPVWGAEVTVFAAGKAGQALPLDETKTEKNGHYMAAVRHRGGIDVAAYLPTRGYQVVTTTPDEEDIKLTLPGPTVLEVEAPADSLVHVWRGSTIIRTVKVGPEGTARIEGLRPGKVGLSLDAREPTATALLGPADQAAKATLP